MKKKVMTFMHSTQIQFSENSIFVSVCYNMVPKKVFCEHILEYFLLIYKQFFCHCKKLFQIKF